MKQSFFLIFFLACPWLGREGLGQVETWDADYNQNSCLDTGDLIEFLTLFGSCGPFEAWWNPDSNGDGCIGVGDMTTFLAYFGEGCSPAEFACGSPLFYNNHHYETVEIGGQCWFAENLQSFMYANGDSLVFDSPGAITEGGCQTYASGDTCTYGGSASTNDFDPCDPIDALANLGLYYNEYAILDERGLCPTGWKVPESYDWLDLMESVTTCSYVDTLPSGIEFGCGNVSELFLEISPFFSYNETGFSAIRGGLVVTVVNQNMEEVTAGGFMNSDGYWWSHSIETDEVGVLHVISELFPDHEFGSTAFGEVGEHSFWLPVRCVQDDE